MWTQSKKLILATLALPLLAGSGCVVNDMADDTHAMRQDTASVSANTTTMNGKMDATNTKLDAANGSMQQVIDKTTGLADRTCTLFSELRQGDARNIRADAFRTQMPKSSTVQGMIDEAGQYFMSFEFQLLDPGNCDSPDTMNELYDSAMQDFFLDVTTVMKDPNAQLNPASTNVADEELFAIAVASQKVNPNRQLIAPDALSALDLIQNSLEQSAAVNSGQEKLSDLPAYQQEVLQNQQAAVQLLRARADFFPAMVLLQITDLQDNSDWGIFNFVKGAFDDIGDLFKEKLGTSANFDNLTVVELEYVSSLMGFANSQIKFLQTQKFSFALNGDIQEFYKNLKLPTAGKTVADGKLKAQALTARSGAEGDLLTNIHAFRKLVGAE